MLSKAQIKLIRSLHQKKYRIKSGRFIAEGPKVITDLFDAGLEMSALYTTQVVDYPDSLTHLVEPAILKKLSALNQANTQLALFKIPEHQALPTVGPVLALDAIRDPGNLGTIIRLCDWFGITDLVCSSDTVDTYNPKTVQATMGSIARVRVHHTDLVEFLDTWEGLVWGADMEGNSAYTAQWPDDVVLVMGNEANGLSGAVRELLNDRICIPPHGNSTGAESLNVAMATSVLLSELRRPTGR